MKTVLLCLVLAACGRNDRVTEATALPGVALGPIRLGMTRAEVEALDLPFHYDPSGQGGDQAIFAGPYQVVLDAAGRVEQVAIPLSRVTQALSVGAARLTATTAFDDAVKAVGDCVAPEPYDGGQRARCGGGGVFVEQGSAPHSPPRIRVVRP